LDCRRAALWKQLYSAPSGHRGQSHLGLDPPLLELGHHVTGQDIHQLADGIPHVRRVEGDLEPYELVDQGWGGVVCQSQ